MKKIELLIIKIFSFQLDFVANLVQPFLDLFRLTIFSINARIDW